EQVEQKIQRLVHEPHYSIYPNPCSRFRTSSSLCACSTSAAVFSRMWMMNSSTELYPATCAAFFSVSYRLRSILILGSNIKENPKAWEPRMTRIGTEKFRED